MWLAPHRSSIPAPTRFPHSARIMCKNIPPLVPGKWEELLGRTELPLLLRRENDGTATPRYRYASSNIYQGLWTPERVVIILKEEGRERKGCERESDDSTTAAHPSPAWEGRTDKRNSPDQGVQRRPSNPTVGSLQTVARAVVRSIKAQ